jgi:HSP20 family protein
LSNNKNSKQEKQKTTVTPNATMDHDDQFYYIQIELPGVKKGDLELSVSDQSFCVRAPRADLQFLGCYVLAHLVDTNRTRAKFQDGLLSIEIPLKTIRKEKKIPIE